jgi:DNA topoisomerase-1
MAKTPRSRRNRRSNGAFCALTVAPSNENADFYVKEIEKGTKTRQPAPPFTTSTLQQDASRKFNFSSKTTIRIAQALYEGIDIKNHGLTGLITYMRTDSLRISEEALTSVRGFISENYGQEALPKTARRYKTKSGAQDAHEAIRPSYVELTPASIKDSLTTDQYKIYKLIWERFVASQMRPCEYACETVVIAAGDHIFRANDQKVTFAGFTALYVEGSDEEEAEFSKIPELCENEKLNLKSLNGVQKFTEPPSRYNEATLIKAMEENGIGRPSTYAPIISIIISREYVKRDGKSLAGTPLGEATTNFMRKHFPAHVKPC